MHLCTLCSKALQIYNKFPKVENTFQKNIDVIAQGVLI